MTVQSDATVLLGTWCCTNCRTVVFNKPGLVYYTVPHTYMANCRVCCRFLENTEFEKIDVPADGQ